MDRARCAVAMYHFVRNMHETPYPGIKGRLVDEFIGQVRYLCQYHEPLRTQDLLRFFDGEGDLPENGFYLTFDDGIKEHYEIVLPVLKGYGLEAAFSPMTEPLVHRRVPSMEKLRFMNNNLDFDMVYEEFFSTLERLFPNVDAGQWRFDEAKAAEARQYARFDEPKLAHFKRATTLEIPMEIRDAVLDNMFPRYFGLDEDFI